MSDIEKEKYSHKFNISIIVILITILVIVVMQLKKKVTTPVKPVYYFEYIKDNKGNCFCYVIKKVGGTTISRGLSIVPMEDCKED